MGKAEIREHLEALNRVGLNFKKDVIILRRGNVEMERNQFVRIALEEQYLNPYGKPDDREAQSRVWEFRWDHVKMLYQELRAEIDTRKKRGIEIPELWVKHRTEIEAMFDESDNNNFYKAYNYVLHNLRVLGLDVAHDQFYKSTYLTHEGIPLGSKFVGEKDVGKMFEDIKKGD